MATLFSFRSALRLLLALPLLLLLGCDHDEAPATAGNVTVAFDNSVGAKPLVLGDTYTSPSGDTYAVQDFKYYISNVILTDAGGHTVFAEPDSYHLVSQTDGKTAFELENVPAGTYSKIAFGLGVDATHNHNIDQAGDLEPITNMVWDWNTGYKFLLLTGTYTGDTQSGGLVFHIGGDDNYKTFTLDLQQPLQVGKADSYSLHIGTDVNAIFQSPNPIDFDALHEAMGGEAATKIVENYSSGFFTVAKVE